MHHLLFLIIGIMVGTVTGIFFFRNEKQWVKYLTFTSGNAGLLAAFWTVLKQFSIPTTEGVSLAITYLASAFFASILTVCGFIYALKKETKNDEIQFKVIDVLLGYHDAIKQYYQSRKKLVDDKLNVTKLNDRKKALEEEEKLLKASKEHLEVFKAEVESSIKKSLHLNLPIGKPVPLDDQFINALPSFTENIVNFTAQLAIFTDEFKKTFDLKKDGATQVLGYFLGICNITAVYLFDSNKVRPHPIL